MDKVIDIDELASVSVLYNGFDNYIHCGELLVHKDLADEVKQIFTELLHAQFPIHKINKASHYDNDDDRLMNNNITSAYNPRKITGKDKWSIHAYGRAIDINPLLNPCVIGDKHYPQAADLHKYLNEEYPGKIDSNSIVYKIFKKYGWTWGGDWTSLKDYHHFEK